MLTHLKIENYVLIKSLEIDFENHFSTVTGETGAGKSIILGALGLILGSRADSSVLLSQDKKCVVEGTFKMNSQALKPFFEENELDWDVNTILRREIHPNGKSRAFVNDTPVTITILKDISEKLIDIHSQHQTLKLMNEDFQVSLLDAFAGHDSLLNDYSTHYKEYGKVTRNLTNLKANQQKLTKEYDYNLYQLKEINAANLQAGEQETLEKELLLLDNAEKIRGNIESLNFELQDSEQAVLNKLNESLRLLTGIAPFNPELQKLLERVKSVIIEIKDINAELEDFGGNISLDNERQNEVNERLNAINQLLSKHHFRDIAQLLAYSEELREQINNAENLSENIESLEKEKKQIEEKLNTLASKISANRHAKKEKLQDSITTLLKQLGIPDAQLIINLFDSDRFTPTGKNKIEILFSANKGSAPAEVGNVASGGELSRLMLCFKSILAGSSLLPTIIFDEIDTGVSGAVAMKVGQLLKNLAEKHQVISITHQAQIASMGDHHYLVYKKTGKELTQTFIRLLSKEERIEEIAKMLGGSRPGNAAIENAKELLTANSA